MLTAGNAPSVCWEYIDFLHSLLRRNEALSLSLSARQQSHIYTNFFADHPQTSYYHHRVLVKSSTHSRPYNKRIYSFVHAFKRRCRLISTTKNLSLYAIQTNTYAEEMYNTTASNSSSSSSSVELQRSFFTYKTQFHIVVSANVYSREKDTQIDRRERERYIHL